MLTSGIGFSQLSSTHSKNIFVSTFSFTSTGYHSLGLERGFIGKIQTPIRPEFNHIKHCNIPARPSLIRPTGLSGMQIGPNKEPNGPLPAR